MGFRKRETDLERELRAQRPQPREEFVRSLSKLVEPVSRPRRSALPKVALVAAVTAVLAASLGVTGALGSAGGSIHIFGSSIVHLISPAHPSTDTVVVSPKIGASTSTRPSSATHQTTTTTTTTTTSPNGALGPSGFPVGPNVYPSFKHQYGFKIPICYGGHIIYVSPFQLFWYLTHGGQVLLAALRSHPSAQPTLMHCGPGETPARSFSTLPRR